MSGTLTDGCTSSGGASLTVRDIDACRTCGSSWCRSDLPDHAARRHPWDLAIGRHDVEAYDLSGGDNDAIARVGVVISWNASHLLADGQIERNNFEGRCVVTEYGDDGVDISAGEWVALLLDRVGEFNERVAADIDPATSIGLDVQFLQGDPRQACFRGQVPDEHLGIGEEPHAGSAFDVFAESVSHLTTNLTQILVREPRS